MKLRRGAGHAVNRAAGPILGDRMMAFRVQNAQSLCSITAHAGEQDADQVSRPELVRTLEEKVNGGTVEAIGWVPRVNQPGGTRKHEMFILAGNQGSAGLRAVAFAGQTYLQWGLAIQPARQARREVWIHVLDDDYWCGKVSRQIGQYSGQGGGSAGGGADADQVIAAVSRLPILLMGDS